jgi:hypothetical protein
MDARQRRPHRRDQQERNESGQQIDERHQVQRRVERAPPARSVGSAAKLAMPEQTTRPARKLR